MLITLLTGRLLLDKIIFYRVMNLISLILFQHKKPWRSWGELNAPEFSKKRLSQKSMEHTRTVGAYISLLWHKNFMLVREVKYLLKATGDCIVIVWWIAEHSTSTWATLVHYSKLLRDKEFSYSLLVWREKQHIMYSYFWDTLEFFSPL